MKPHGCLSGALLPALVALALISPFSSATAQSLASIVKGVVQSTGNEPLTGVSVVIKNLKTNFTTGTATDSSGVFGFSGIQPGGPYSFSFSMVGFENQTLSGYSLKADATLSFVVKLVQLGTSLDQVVSGIITSGTALKEEWSIVSQLARINYNYGGRYLIIASIRRDGSSRFGANNKYGVFPSAALAWRVSDERFMQNLHMISEFKLRAGNNRKDVRVQCCGSWKNPATGVVTTSSSSTSQSYTMKYITSVNSQNDSKANWKVVRYADVLLMYAEALNENGKTSTALTPLNQLRTRAGLSSLSGLTQTGARNSIMQERRFERCFEGHRWLDLVRTGRALAACAPVGMKDYMFVFPVPLAQVRVINNATIFLRNAGYN